MKRGIAIAATILLIGSALWFGRDRSPGAAGKSADTAEQCIERMFEAAKQGDVEAYVQCFSGPERARVDKDLAKAPRQQFAQSLRDAVASLQGRATLSPTENERSGDDVTLSVERIYTNRNETQTYHLRRLAGMWRIFEVESAKPFQPPIPFGTPVYQPSGK